MTGMPLCRNTDPLCQLFPFSSSADRALPCADFWLALPPGKDLDLAFHLLEHCQPSAALGLPAR
jgi:hypothetical protein